MNHHEGNFVGAVIAGVIAAVICAIIWGAISIATGYQIGWIAVGVGFVVGAAVRVVGKGTLPIFGIIAGALSLFAVVLGNVICIAGALASLSGGEEIPEKISTFSAFLTLLTNPMLMMEMLGHTFHPMDLLFYGLAIYVGFKTAVGSEES